MTNLLSNVWFHTFGKIINQALFRINYLWRFRQYEYVYHLLIEEFKSDTAHTLPEYRELRRIIGVGGTDLFGCHGISDKEAAKKYERIFKKYGLVCSYQSDIPLIYQHFKDEYVH